MVDFLGFVCLFVVFNLWRADQHLVYQQATSEQAMTEVLRGSVIITENNY